MGCDVFWVGPLPHARLLDYLEKGQIIDGDPLISMNSERKNFLYYPKNPFLSGKTQFCLEE